MELRSTRSRSRTPFLQTTSDEDFIIEQQNHINEETVVTHSYSTRNRTQKLNSTLSDEVFESPSKQKSQKVVTRSRHKTSDYSSEEGENEISSSKGNGHTRSQLSAEKNSSNNGEIKSALQVYKEAGEYWNKYPKTDYTYSIHSKDRVELAPGVVAMPNMSRRSLRRSEEHTTQSSTTNYRQQSNYYSDQTNRIKSDYKYDYNTKLEPKALFQEEIDAEYEERSSSIIRRIYHSSVSVFVRVVTRILTILQVVSRSFTSSVLWIGRKYYKVVSRMLLFDTWLLQSNSSKSRMGPLIALFLLPLLLLTGWWLCSGLTQTLQGVFFSSPDTSAAGTIDNIPLEEQLSKLILAGSENSKEQFSVNDIVVQLLENPAFEQIIAKHIKSKTADFDQQRKLFEALKNEIASVRLESARSNAKLSMELNRCCKRQFIHVESYIKKLFADLIGSSNTNIQPEHVSSWLHNIFVAKQDLESRLSNLTQNLHSDLENLIEISADKIMTDVTNKINLKLRENLEFSENINVNSALSDSQVRRIVKEALAVYDADKTGLVDYALESSGGQILSTRCTESYNKNTAVVSILGVPLWYPSNTPRTVITPGVTPGECWAFQNFPGYLVIELSAKVKISAFSVEHIPKTLSPGGVRDSAPKAFIVSGLHSENDRDPWQLGSYVYDLEGPSLQFFHVQTEGPAFKIIELKIESNHGNMNYTCLYRFRVHGVTNTEPT